MSNSQDELLYAMDKATNAWIDKSARGECGWICTDCCISFPDGMPDTCPHGSDWCTEIIQRDKRRACSGR